LSNDERILQSLRRPTTPGAARNDSARGDMMRKTSDKPCETCRKPDVLCRVRERRKRKRYVFESS